MPIREVKVIGGHYYHIFNRGVNRQPIFFQAENWSFFIRRLRNYAKPELVDVVAYCLMPNHYHLLVHVKTDSFGEQVMQPFGLSYVRAINKQQSRTGPLFEGPYKSVHVDRDEYLRHLSRYIHLNPVAAGLVARPQDWAYSSYRDYVGLRQGTLPHPTAVLAHFRSQRAYHDFVLGPDPVRNPIPPQMLLD